ncbi:hypothetical protein [Pseudomonas sp. RIT-PI-S]|uniref:hypothetical protein n=1 Tax=Pseudomonas sp. RIT-PI-S TaxID=3035295 RepID=UPI0021DAAA4B|nr:hypothetical protein [Pseudomonas sp. RIT-PI-S]
MSQIDLKLTGASMEHHVQLSLDFHSVAERVNEFPTTLQPIPYAIHHRFEQAPEQVFSNVVALTARASPAVSRHNDLVSRILKSVRFYG